MHRNALTYLENHWFLLKDRKPLILRGARQVGKTWIARTFAQNNKLTLVEINFEKNPEAWSLFERNEPKEVLKNIELYKGIKIDPSSSLLFLDEIQEAPEVLPKLRWFYEEMQELPIMAAGSLLEFILSDHTFSMPVGRVSYLHIEPFSFEEFLRALKKDLLLNYIQEIEPPFQIPEAIHQALRDSFKLYSAIGGMPACVARWVETESLLDVIPLQEDLLSTYRDDFFKYKGRFEVTKLHAILRSIPFQLGEKFTYSKADPTIQSVAAKQILSLFNKARICHRVQSTSANGVPLSAECNEKQFKQIFLDIGLTHRMLSNNFENTRTAIEGGLTEQIVGQLLRTLSPLYKDPELYYWHREEKGSSAEIDYLIEHKGEIIPIEVKAGSTGGLKSLHLFMEMKKKYIAVRINDDMPSITPIHVKTRHDSMLTYCLLSIPFYLTTQLKRLLDTDFLSKNKNL